MIPTLQEYLQEKLVRRDESNSRRVLPQTNALIDFCSNDYLGISRNTEVLNTVNEKFKNQHTSEKNGATGSRLISGNYGIYEALEQKLSQIHRSEKTLIFNSGYNANLAVLSCLPQKGDTILYDELSHACIKDGARLSLAERFSFRHNDLEDLSRKLIKAKGRIFIVVESIYSMDGDVAPLTHIASLAKFYNATIIVDEAHSTGIWGKQGGGLVNELKLENEIIIRIHTYGKAMGCHGACVAAPAYVIDYLVNFARPFIYTTGLPLHSLLTIEAAYEHIGQHPELATALFKNIRLFRNLILKSIATTNSESAIQTVIVPGNENVKKLAESLQEKGFDVRPILSPTVKEGLERLRICLHNYNTEAEITSLAEAINLESEIK